MSPAVGSNEATSPVAAAVQEAYRGEWTRVLAATVRVTGDLGLAEECVQDAFVAALDTWPVNGVPANPGAWLTTTAKRRALDSLRRASTLRGKLPLLIEPESVTGEVQRQEESVIADDRLRLVFTCCHPALSAETQAALTLRLVCGVPTADIAQLFLVSETTMAARITRGKRKIEVARIPFVMPQASDLEHRLDAVLTVIHLFFTAGHTATSGDALVDREVAVRAVRLGRLLHALLPSHPEVAGLLALMLLTDAWDLEQITEGRALTLEAMSTSGPPGRYALQAAIASAHAGPRPEDTDWTLVVSLYDRLLEVWPSPVVQLNRAVAVSMSNGPQAGLEAIDSITEDSALRDYHYLRID